MAIQLSSRDDPAVRAIVARWRGLTGGRGVPDAQRATLVACSGGADSSGLVLALATRVPSARIVVGHVIHDLRPPAEARGDAARAAAMAGALGLPFSVRAVAVREESGNAEAVARRLRTQALAAMAREQGCALVATAHHADDQLETVLMRLLRGASATGLGGVAPSRDLGAGVTLIRPCLGVARADLAGLCARCGVVPAHDATNDDLTRTRAYLRHRVIPGIVERFPHAPARAGRTAESARALGPVVRAAGRDLLDRGGVESGPGWIMLRRAALRGAPAEVAGEALRQAIGHASGGHGMDRVSARVVRSVLEAVEAKPDRPRRFVLRHAVVTVGARTVRVERRSS